jgi:phage baseplate assembly protein W
MRAWHYTSDDALGAGLDFPFAVSGGGLASVRDEEKVRQSILMILSTAKGERVMRPDFGCDLHSFVFSTIDRATLTLIKSAVRDALVRWEPRITVDAIETRLDPRDDGRLLIEVAYTTRHTSFPNNLVYPFYLQREDA